MGGSVGADVHGLRRGRRQADPSNVVPAPGTRSPPDHFTRSQGHCEFQATRVAQPEDENISLARGTDGRLSAPLSAATYAGNPCPRVFCRLNGSQGQQYALSA